MPQDHEPPAESGPATGKRVSARNDWMLLFRATPFDVCVQKSEYVSVEEIQLPAPEADRREDGRARAVVVGPVDGAVRRVGVVVLERDEGRDRAEELGPELDAPSRGDASRGARTGSSAS